MGSRYPDTPEATERRRRRAAERLDEKYRDDPTAEVCRICGARRSPFGIAIHMRQQHGTFLFQCECGKGFNTEDKYEAHLESATEVHKAMRERAARKRKVDRIAKKPYHEFLKELSRL